MIELLEKFRIDFYAGLWACMILMIFNGEKQAVEYSTLWWYFSIAFGIMYLISLVATIWKTIK